jgi:hypothetical protein
VDGHHYTLVLKSTGAKTSSGARLGSLCEGFLPVSELQQADTEKSNVHKPQGGGCYTDIHMGWVSAQELARLTRALEFISTESCPLSSLPF